MYFAFLSLNSKIDSILKFVLKGEDKMLDKEMRLEVDGLGEVQVPAHAYYGASTVRAMDNFQMTGQMIDEDFIIAMAAVKKAACLANCELGFLTERKSVAIVQACDEIIEGKLHEQFVTDVVQGGAGTSFNMNINEVIANRANEILGYALGTYEEVKVNDDVNLGQSTNDVIPTAAKLALYRKAERLESVLQQNITAYEEKASEFDAIIKMGRTHLQDAVPMRLGQQFAAFAASTQRDLRRLDFAKNDLTVINMGATAIGTSINTTERYIEKVTKILADISGIPFVTAENFVDATRNADYYLWLSSSLKLIAVNASKIAHDIRLMSSGPITGLGEINVPPLQPGSSIMPGKVNPVIPEMLNQIAFAVMGNDVTITNAVESGQLELNVFGPIMLKKLFESLTLLTNGLDAFASKTISGITANQSHIEDLIEKSAGIATAIAPQIGYTEASRVVKKALNEGKTIRKVLLDEGQYTDEELSLVLDMYKMTEPQK